MTTFGNLKTYVARDLRDESNKSFSATVIGDLINDAINKVSDIIPRQFQEDITPDGSQSYQILDGDATRRTALYRVEIWQAASGSLPDRYYCTIPSLRSALVNNTQAGWTVEGGSILIPYRYAQLATTDAYILRLWGTTPYLQLVNDGDTADLDSDAEFAVRECATAEGYDRLLASRALFGQWQTQANNTDMSFAQALSLAERYRQAWKDRRRQLSAMRQMPD